MNNTAAHLPGLRLPMAIVSGMLLVLLLAVFLASSLPPAEAHAASVYQTGKGSNADWRTYLPIVSRPLCNGYEGAACFNSFASLAKWTPARVDPRAVASVPLAPRAGSRFPKMLVGNDYSYWDYAPFGDGQTQGGTDRTLYPFNYWQYVDVMYYYRHGLVTVPPVVWINAAHRNGVLMLGSVTTDITNGKVLFAELFAPTHWQTTVRQLTLLASSYGFDGWLIDLESEENATPEVVQAIQALRQNGLYILYYQAYRRSLDPDDLIQMQLANAASAWQSDYGLSEDDPPTTYNTLKAQASGLSPENAFSAAYLFANTHKPPCAAGELNNSLSCNPINTFYNYLSYAVSTTAPAEAWTSLAVFAPSWPAYGGTSGVETVPKPEVWQPLDEKIWQGKQPQGPACSTANSGGLSQWVVPRTVLTHLPFFTRFNRGIGPQYAVEGAPAAARGWNHFGAQQVLPTWLCQVTNTAGLTVTLEDGEAWDGATALAFHGNLPAGETAEWALWQAQIPVDNALVARLRFASLNALAPYLRLSFSDQSEAVITATFSSGTWNTYTQTVPQAQGKTLTRVSAGVYNPTAAALPAAIRLGELALATPADLNPLPLVTPTVTGSLLVWLDMAGTAAAYSNVWTLDRDQGCLRYLGPAFAASYDLLHPLFPPPAAFIAAGYIVQPVSAAGVAAPLPQARCVTR